MIVSVADISKEPRQPNRFEKKKNIRSLPCPRLSVAACGLEYPAMNNSGSGNPRDDALVV